MAIIAGAFALLVLGGCAFLFLALLKWLVLFGIVVLYSVGLVALAIAGITGFGLYQVFGAGYGPLAIAVAIAAGLASAVLMLRRIAVETGISPKPPKGSKHAR